MQLMLNQRKQCKRQKIESGTQKFENFKGVLSAQQMVIHW
jgi:hypothetical protein